MKINLLCIGKTDRKELQVWFTYYEKRLPKHWNFDLIEIPDLKNSKNLSIEQIKKEESKLLLQKIENTDHVIILDEKGVQKNSKDFAKNIEYLMLTSTKRVVIIIGGAYGFSEEIYKRANEKMGLSKMTFTHQMVRLFIIEQLYRADQILQGKPYHNN